MCLLSADWVWGSGPFGFRADGLQTTAAACGVRRAGHREAFEELPTSFCESSLCHFLTAVTRVGGRRGRGHAHSHVGTLNGPSSFCRGWFLQARSHRPHRTGATEPLAEPFLVPLDAVPCGPLKIAIYGLRRATRSVHNKPASAQPLSRKRHWRSL